MPTTQACQRVMQLKEAAVFWYLDEVLALSFGDQRLKLWRSECIDQSGLGNNEQ